MQRIREQRQHVDESAPLGDDHRGHPAAVGVPARDHRAVGQRAGQCRRPRRCPPGRRRPIPTAGPSAGAAGRAGCSAPPASRGAAHSSQIRISSGDSRLPPAPWVSTTTPVGVAGRLVGDRRRCRRGSLVQPEQRRHRTVAAAQRVCGAQTFGDPGLAEGHRVGHRSTRAPARTRWRRPTCRRRRGRGRCRSAAASNSWKSVPSIQQVGAVRRRPQMAALDQRPLRARARAGPWPRRAGCCRRRRRCRPAAAPRRGWA